MTRDAESSFSSSQNSVSSLSASKNVAWLPSLASWTSLQQRAAFAVEAVAHTAADAAEPENLDQHVRFQEDSLPHSSIAHEAVDTAAAAVQAQVLGTARSGNPAADSQHRAAYYYSS